MARIARDYRLTAIVVPRARDGLAQRVRRALGRFREPLAGLGAPLVDVTEIEHLRPDAIVVASFPQLVPAATLAAARIGALNVHMSLLPRHRGVDPVFWTYWDDDREAGVTIHWMNERFDAGDIAAQEALPLERGRGSRELYMQLASRAVELLASVLSSLASGTPPRRPQDESAATYESADDIARARLPFAQWPAERVWHVLSGLGDQRSGLLADHAGRPLEHGQATSYRLARDIDPGRIVAVSGGYEVHCRDGVVVVDGRN
jgi:methionyl-tRNA formyltransferase